MGVLIRDMATLRNAVLKAIDRTGPIDGGYRKERGPAAAGAPDSDAEVEVPGLLRNAKRDSPSLVRAYAAAAASACPLQATKGVQHARVMAVPRHMNDTSRPSV